MKNAIIVHGKPTEQEYYDPNTPSESNSHWLPWLQKQLLVQDIVAVTPEMPRPFDPSYDAWQKEIERYELTPDTMLVGHSCGGGFWVRYLSEHPDIRVGKVVLVAPWLDPDNDEAGSFFDFRIDPDLAARTQGVIIFNADNDMGNVHKSVALLREQIKDIQYKEFHKYGHFTYNDLDSDEFPELLKELV